MELKSPLDVQVEVTSGCNHRCGYCYNPFEHSNVSMAPEDVKNVLDILNEKGVFSFIFTGGEPFLNRAGLMEGVSKILSFNKGTYINTNLSIPLNDEDINRLAGVSNILFSFPSCDPKKFNQIVKCDSWRNVNRNLELLAQTNIPFTPNQVVTLGNDGELFQSAKFLKETYGIKGFCASPVHPSGCDRRDYAISLTKHENIVRDLVKVRDELGLSVDMPSCVPLCLFPKDLWSEEFLYHSCSAGRSTMTISSNGDMRRCIETKEVYGNIFTDDFSEVWDKMKLSSPKPKPSACEGCSVPVGCYNGCYSREEKNEGRDFLIQGAVQGFLDRDVEMRFGSEYRLKKFMYREERLGEYIITDGGSFLVTGNKELVNVLNEIGDDIFTIEKIRKGMGEKGVGVIKYLNNRGMVEYAKRD